MKNLFRFLANSLAHTTYPTLGTRLQNKHSDGVYATFFTSDGDELQTFESTDAGITFGKIKILLKEPYVYVTDAAQVLHHFLHLLQSSFDIEHVTDGVYTFSKQNKQYITTLYWQDVKQTDWKVLGWTDGEQMDVRYIKNINSLPVEWEDFFFRDLQAA